MPSARLCRFVRLTVPLLLGAAALSKAADLKVRPWPLTDNVYEAIDKESVRVEMYMPETAWLEQVGNQNTELAEGLALTPVATIDVVRLYDEEEIGDTMPLVEAARKCAATFGANAVYLDRKLMQEKELDGMRFIAYRAEFKHNLISPTYLAALPFVSVPSEFLDDQLQAWQKSHFGVQHVSLTTLASLKNGTSVRVVLRDGTNVQGRFSGIDEDKQLWIHPAGFGGLFRDRSFPTQNVQAVSLLN